MVTKTVHEHREQMRGGKGSAEMYHIIEKTRIPIPYACFPKSC